MGSDRRLWVRVLDVRYRGHKRRTFLYNISTYLHTPENVGDGGATSLEIINWSDFIMAANEYRTAQNFFEYLFYGGENVQ